MARIYEVIEKDGYWVPTVRSDDEGWIHTACSHKHRSNNEAQKCLFKSIPRYMKYRRNKE